MNTKGWRTCRIDEVGEVQGGRQRSPHAQGKLRPYLRVANVFAGYIDSSDVLEMPFTDREFERFVLKRGDILLNEGQSMELVGRSAIYTGDPPGCCYQNTLIRFRPGPQVDARFARLLFDYCQNQGIFSAIAARTTSIAHLGVERFASLKVSIPPFDEQKEIARIFNNWDQAIDLAEHLIATKQERRKWLLQQLLTGTQRLPEFEPLRENAWKEAELSRLFRPINRRNSKGLTKVLSASGEHGLVDQTQYFNRSVAGESLDNYLHIRRGEYAYNRSSMNGYPYGAIKRLEDHEEGVLSSLYLCFQLVSKDCHSDYYKHLFESRYLDYQLRKIAQIGARAHGLLNVTARDFFSMKVPCPPIEEQRRIAETLDVADRELNLLRSQLEALREQKKGLTQQLLTGKKRVNIPITAAPAERKE